MRRQASMHAIARPEQQMRCEAWGGLRPVLVGFIGDDALAVGNHTTQAAQAIGKLCQIISGGFLVCQWQLWTCSVHAGKRLGELLG